ncbi:class I SAM-dependent methyltransferase [Ornithinimicrobium cryptoxanthini]|uniref:Class I SAM-dependent methyltransferase n=1 Tax=Ornithinimicrobium cryptoxanthini TaxID=2934161 RepID=A0ABY4YL78_9MICO|nr:class I SAM-dependent methyltransferase [Ornithinimicrobium cryptoxanthini]USQ77444.1 class I SAM-dependent methyltransferase [Ornithinimicrobium cryptoxanthini]
MAFNAADSYDRFMGRFSRPLAQVFADRTGVRAGQRALDVGCGPGALTEVLIERLGLDHVEAVDPSPPFVAAIAERFPGLSVREGTAEHLPHADDSFDLSLAQLVVHFMADPVAGLRQMARVTRPGGTVAAAVWDLTPGARGPVSPFQTAVAEVDPSWVVSQARPGGARGELGELFRSAGLRQVEESVLTAEVPIASFEDWWEPFLLGIGPAGDYVAGLDERARHELRERTRRLLPDGAFTMPVDAWCAVATV